MSRRAGWQTSRRRAYAYERLKLIGDLEDHSGKFMAANRTWEIRPCGIKGGPVETWSMVEL